MIKASPTAFGLTTAQLENLAKNAGREAIAENIRAGVPTTVRMDGTVQTLKATDPRLQELVNGRSGNVRDS
jgi:hypothetical protein